MNSLKKISLLFTVLILSALRVHSNNPDSISNIQQAENQSLQQAYPTVIVYTPEIQTYDDGVFLTAYTGYRIFDLANNLLLRVGTAIEQPVRLKIKQGEYMVVPDCNKDSIYLMTVKSGIINEFIISQSVSKNVRVL